MDYKRLINVFCLSLVRCGIIYGKPLPVKDLKPAKKWVNNPTKPNLIALTMGSTLPFTGRSYSFYKR